jgi:transcriptional regulator with XRE-family HTH domain
MNVGNDVVNISDVPPLALLDLRAKIATAQKLHPERLGRLFTRYCSLLKQIREQKDLTIRQLSALCGSSEEFLEAAESGNQMTDDDLETLHGVYWELATGEDHPGEFKRLANERLATPYPEFGSPMREIRERKELSIEELCLLSGVPEDILERAELGAIEMIGEGLDDVRRVYWSLAALEASPADYKLLLKRMATDSGAE